MASSMPGSLGVLATADGNGHSASTTGLWALFIGAIGVVYGDIGTSPIYAFRVATLAASDQAGVVSEAAVFGVLSLIFWTLILIVTLKYVIILIRADNNGEGGTLALMALAQRAFKGMNSYIFLLGVIAAALF
jgi:KUP system potassium uptake protein